jgi:hypothetical protein
VAPLYLWGAGNLTNLSGSFHVFFNFPENIWKKKQFFQLWPHPTILSNLLSYYVAKFSCHTKQIIFLQWISGWKIWKSEKVHVSFVKKWGRKKPQNVIKWRKIRRKVELCMKEIILRFEMNLYHLFESSVHLRIIIDSLIDWLINWLIIYGFTSCSRIFFLLITGEGLQNVGLCSALRALNREGSSPWHTYFDTRPRFFRSHPKDRGVQSPFTIHKGVWRSILTRILMSTYFEACIEVFSYWAVETLDDLQSTSRCLDQGVEIQKLIDLYQFWFTGCAFWQILSLWWCLDRKDIPT